ADREDFLEDAGGYDLVAAQGEGSFDDQRDRDDRGDDEEPDRPAGGLDQREQGRTLRMPGCEERSASPAWRSRARLARMSANCRCFLPVRARAAAGRGSGPDRGPAGRRHTIVRVDTARGAPAASLRVQPVPPFPQVPAPVARNREILTVSELNGRVAGLIESNLGPLWVTGEISNFVRAASGHCYFTLKDAGAQVRCVMFRSRARALAFEPREGHRVEVLAQPSLYQARGDFQLGVEQMRQAGAGDLFQEFMRLRARLEAEGLFDPRRKRPIAPLPRAIGVVTSPAAAALRDVLTTLAR